VLAIEITPAYAHVVGGGAHIDRTQSSLFKRKKS